MIALTSFLRRRPLGTRQLLPAATRSMGFITIEARLVPLVQGLQAACAAAVLLLSSGCVTAGPSNSEATAKPQPSKPGYIGIGYRDVTQDGKLPRQNGVLIMIVGPRTPAAAAGLKEADVIVALDDKVIADAASLSAVIKQLPPGKQIVVRFTRDGQAGTATLTVGEIPLEAYLERVDEKTTKGDWAGAIADSTEAIRLDPLNAHAYHFRSIAKENLGNWSGALVDSTEAIRLDPKNARAYLARGVANSNTGNLVAAIADYTEAIHLDPDILEAYTDRAIVRDLVSDKNGAAQDRAFVAGRTFATFQEGIAKASFPDLLASSDKRVDFARERNRTIVTAKNQQLPVILRDRKTDELSALVIKIEQTILDLDHEGEVAKDHAQQAAATNGDAGQIDELRGLGICYRERIELLKPILAALKDEIANRSR